MYWRSNGAEAAAALDPVSPMIKRSLPRAARSDEPRQLPGPPSCPLLPESDPGVPVSLLRDPESRWPLDLPPFCASLVAPPSVDPPGAPDPPCPLPHAAKRGKSARSEEVRAEPRGRKRARFMAAWLLDHFSRPQTPSSCKEPLAPSHHR